MNLTRPGNGANSTSFKDDLFQSIEVLLGELLHFKEKERVLLYIDEGSDRELAVAIRSRIMDLDGYAEILFLSQSETLETRSQSLSETIRKGNFQIACELSEQYFYLTSSWRIARNQNIRIFSLAGLDSLSFVRCLGKVNHATLFNFGANLKKCLKQMRHVRITDGNGTDLSMYSGGTGLFHKILYKFHFLPRSFIKNQSGFLNKKVRSTFLGGQIAFLPVLKTINGTAIIDGSIWPPHDLGHLEEPMKLIIKSGMVVEIAESNPKSSILKDWVRDLPVEIEHFCIGFNPGARLSGKILEAERVLGAIAIGFGKGMHHTDCIITKPTIQTDSRILIRQGTFVPDELADTSALVRF